MTPTNARTAVTHNMDTKLPADKTRWLSTPFQIVADERVVFCVLETWPCQGAAISEHNNRVNITNLTHIVNVIK